MAYETLKNAIVTGEIPAGSRIVETEYAERMHISRTPLREALRKLERDGLVEYVVRRGVVVRAFYHRGRRGDLHHPERPGNADTARHCPQCHRRGHPGRSVRCCKEMDAFDETGDIEALSPRARAFHTQLTRLSKMNRILRVIESQDQYITRFSALSIARGNAAARGAPGASPAGGLGGTAGPGIL